MTLPLKAFVGVDFRLCSGTFSECWEALPKDCLDSRKWSLFS